MASSLPIGNDKGAAKRFYHRHHKSLYLDFLLDNFQESQSLQEFLEKIFPGSEGEASEPTKSAGKSASLPVSLIRSFLATSFPPVMVGSVALEHINYTEKGKFFPQFSHVGGSTIKCKICIPHQKWGMENQQTYHKLKSKHASIQSILDGTTILNFSGVVQAEEHSRSKCHQDAL